MFRQIGKKLNLKIRICHRIGISVGKLPFQLWFPMQIALIFPFAFAIVIRVAVCIVITLVAFFLATAAFIVIGVSVTVATAAS